MPEKIKFIGYRHMNGTSKRSGNTYDFYLCYFLVPFIGSQLDAEGVSAVEYQISKDLFISSDMADCIGSEGQVFFNQFGRVIGLKFK